MLADHPMPATIVFASFTGEEAGLLGSREFVRRAVESKMQIVGALNNDMIGWANDQRLDNTIRYSNPGIRDIQHGAAMLFTKLITYDALYFKSTDAAAYYDAYGDIVGGIGSYPVLSNPHYHQAHDLLEFVNHQLIAETSKTTAATLMLLASSPSRLKDLKVDSDDRRRRALSWTPSPEKGVTRTSCRYGRPDDDGDDAARQLAVGDGRHGGLGEGGERERPGRLGLGAGDRRSDGAVKRGVSPRPGVATRLLGAIERFVCERDDLFPCHLLRPLGNQRKRRESDGAGAAQRPAVTNVEDVLFDRHAEAFDRHRRSVAVGESEYDEKLFASPARDGIGGAAGVAQHIGELHQYLVACGVPELVVDALEVIDVDQHEHQIAMGW